MFKFNKKRVLALATVAALAVAGIAYAYWTTTGAGTGSATNASSNGTIDLHASFADGLTPGGSKTVTFTADNAGTSSLRVGTVQSVVSIDAAHVALGCSVDDFSIADVDENQTIAAGATGVTLAHTGLIAFADTAVNQDGCKGAKVTLTLSSN
jgi:hypothetical protein